MRHSNQEWITTFKTKTQAEARSVALSALLCVGITLSACTTMGSGSGSVSPGGAPVTFAWKSTDGGTSGTMSATLTDGTTFSGPYRQVTGEAPFDDDSPLFEGYPPGWDDRGPFAQIPALDYTTLYSRRAIAHLQAGDGLRMRCRFDLNTPEDGMAGGGRGKCQLQNGRSVDAVFPPT